MEEGKTIVNEILTNLFAAIEQRSEVDVEKLAHDLINSNRTTDDKLNKPSWMHGGRCLVFEAVRTNDSNLLEALLRGCGERLNVNLRNNQGLTPLHFAVRQRNAPMVKLLLSHPGCDPDIKDNLLAQIPLHEMVSSLHRPLRIGDQPHVSLLKPFSLIHHNGRNRDCLVPQSTGYDGGGHPDGEDSMVSTSYSNDEVLHLDLFASLAERCDFNIPCRSTKESILHRLAAKESPTSFALLQWVLTPSNPKVVDRCNFNLQNSEGETPLMVALEWGNEENSRQLIEAGTDLFARNKFGETALHIAARKNRVNSMELMLRRRVCPVGARDMSGNIPLHLAAARGFEAIVMLLADVNAREALVRSRNREGDTPLDLALGGGFINIAKELIRRAEPPNKRRAVARVSPKLSGSDFIIESSSSSPPFVVKTEDFESVALYHRGKRRPADEFDHE